MYICIYVFRNQLFGKFSLEQYLMHPKQILIVYQLILVQRQELRLQVFWLLMNLDLVRATILLLSG